MKSIALIIWLTLASGKEQVVLTRHMDDLAKCQAAAQVVVDDYAAQGKKARYLCHEVIEEVGDVDENGNPLTPVKASTL